MSALGRLFGTDTAIEKTIDTIGKIADEAFYTNEEEAKDRRAALTQAQGMVVEWLKTTSGSNISRRILALAISGFWLLFLLIATVFEAMAPWLSVDTEGLAPIEALSLQQAFDDKVATSIATMDARAGNMQDAVIIILLFYFAAPHAGAVIQSVLQRFTAPKPAP